MSAVDLQVALIFILKKIKVVVLVFYQKAESFFHRDSNGYMARVRFKLMGFLNLETAVESHPIGIQISC